MDTLQRGFTVETTWNQRGTSQIKLGADWTVLTGLNPQLVSGTVSTVMSALRGRLILVVIDRVAPENNLRELDHHYYHRKRALVHTHASVSYTHLTLPTS